MSKSEKYGLIGILTVLVIALVICALVSVKDKGTSTEELSNDPETIYANAQKESAEVTDTEKKEFIQIDANQYLEMYNGSEKHLVLLARPTCGYCQVAEPIIQKLMHDYNIDIYYLNTDNFSADDETNVAASDKLFESGLGTPMLLLVGESKIQDNVDGVVDTAHYKVFFENNGFIKEK